MLFKFCHTIHIPPIPEMLLFCLLALVQHTYAFGPKPGSNVITTFFAPYDVAPSSMDPR